MTRLFNGKSEVNIMKNYGRRKVDGGKVGCLKKASEGDDELKRVRNNGEN